MCVNAHHLLTHTYLFFTGGRPPSERRGLAQEGASPSFTVGMWLWCVARTQTHISNTHTRTHTPTPTSLILYLQQRRSQEKRQDLKKKVSKMRLCGCMRGCMSACICTPHTQTHQTNTHPHPTYTQLTNPFVTGTTTRRDLEIKVRKCVVVCGELACVWACGYVCMCVCVRMCVCVCARMCMHALYLPVFLIGGRPPPEEIEDWRRKVPLRLFTVGMWLWCVPHTTNAPIKHAHTHSYTCTRTHTPTHITNFLFYRQRRPPSKQDLKRR